MVQTLDVRFGVPGLETPTGSFRVWYKDRYAVDIAPDFITWFVDGKETYQTVNPFGGVNWYPLMNVAVKHNGDYVGGTGEMRVRSFAVWKKPA